MLVKREYSIETNQGADISFTMRSLSSPIADASVCAAKNQSQHRFAGQVVIVVFVQPMDGDRFLGVLELPMRHAVFAAVAGLL
jgi:hypothetical protein